MLNILDRLGDDYLRGQDLRNLVDPNWLDTGLVSFMQAANGKEIEAELAAAEQEMRKVHAREPWPQVYPVQTWRWIAVNWRRSRWFGLEVRRMPGIARSSTTWWKESSTSSSPKRKKT